MSGALCLVRLRPDMRRLSAWALATRQAALRADEGYALHAAAHATLGDLAPQTFRLRTTHGRLELVGYVRKPAAEVLALRDLPPNDDAAAAALGLTALDARDMPAEWQPGRRLSFEVRVAPVVRSRQAVAGRVVEVDAAYHDSFAGDQPGERGQAYERWLRRELSRDGAAELCDWQMQAFALTPFARRHQAAAPTEARALAQGLLPDLTACGELTIEDGAAFARLLSRGIGRHRAFGYGCLLLAPPGVLFHR